MYAVVAEDSATSQVARGENSGRTLLHVSVARSLTRVGTVRGPATETIDLPLGATTGATGKRHLVLFAQAAGLGPVVWADTAPIEGK